MILALQQDLKINGVDVLKNWKNQCFDKLQKEEEKEKEKERVKAAERALESPP